MDTAAALNEYETVSAVNVDDPECKTAYQRLQKASGK
jgi:hypothetical protein